MSKTVDKKIVELGMDNADLVSKAAQSTKALGGLQNSLGNLKGKDLSSVSSSLRGIGSGASEAASKSSLLSEAADTIKSRFSAMGIASMAVITNLTNRAVNAATQLAQSFTLTPIKEGLDMYENKMKSIQVILSNTQGKSNLKDVQDALGSLNDYANKTVYSFQDMTTNMGTFTAAGVDLNTAKDAIQGIGNLAAASGSSTEQAGTAMYQLSQAIASGSVKLQDWNSVVNAGMGGTKFQDALKKNGVEMGKNIKMTDNFRESLQNGWLTTDVLMKTLRQFKDDKSMEEAATQSKTFSDAMDQANDALKSGWATTWEKLLGDYSQAPKLWTAFASTVTGSIDAAAKSRNDLLQGFDEMGGRQVMIDAISTAFKNLGQVLSIVKAAFHSIFPPQTASSLFAIAVRVREFANSLSMSGSTANKVYTVFKGLFAAIDIGRMVVSKLMHAFMNLIPPGVNNSILDFVSGLAQTIINIHDSMAAGNSFTEALDTMGSAASTASNILSGLMGMLRVIGGAFDAMGHALYNSVSPAFSSVFKNLKSAIGNISATDIVAAGFSGTLVMMSTKFNGVQKAIKKFIDALTGSLGGQTGGKIKDFFDSITEGITGMVQSVKIMSLVAIAAAVMMLAVSFRMVANMDVKDISKGLEVVGASLFALSITLKSLSKLKMQGSAIAQVALILALAHAIMEISVALKILSTIDAEGVGRSLTALAGILAIVVASMKALSKINGPVLRASAGIAILSASLVLFTASVVALSLIPVENLKRGLTGIGVALGEIAAFALIVNHTKISPTVALSIALIGLTIDAMLPAIMLIGNMPIDKIQKGIGALGAILGEFSAFSVVVSRVRIPPSVALGVLLVTASINAMIPPIKQLGAMDKDSLIKGLSALGIMLAEIAAFTIAMNFSSMTMGAALGISQMTLVLRQMLPPIKTFASMPLKTMAQSLGGVAIALGELVLAMKLSEGSMGGALALTAAAIGLGLLVGPLKVLSSIPIMGLVAGLGALGVALVMLIGASKLIGLAGSLGLLSFSAAIGMLGIAIGAVGMGIAAFTAALGAMAATTGVAIVAAVANFGKLLTELRKIVPQMMNLATDIMIAFLNGIIRVTPKIVQTGMTILTSFLEGISDNIFEVTEVVIEIIAKFIEALAEGLPKLLQAGADFMISFINGLADTIRKNTDKLFSAIGNLIEAILEILVKGLFKVLDSLLGWIPGVHEALKNGGDAAVKGLREGFNVKGIGEDGGQQFADGVSSKADAAYNAGVVLKQHAEDGTAEGTDSKGTTSVMYNHGQQAGAQYGLGVQSGKPGAQTHGQELANGVQTGADNPDAMKTTGAGVSSAYNYGLKSNSPGAFSAGNQLANNAHTGSKTDLSGNGQAGGSSFNGGLGGQAGGAGAAGSLLKNNAHASTQVDLSGNGAAGGSSFNGGLSNQAGGAGNAGHHVAHTAKENMKVDTTGTGKYAGQGFIDGLGSKVGDAIDAAVKFGKAAAHWLAKSILVASPSRVTMQTGVYFGQGFINGINGTANDAETAATSLGQQSVTALKSVGNQINDLMNNSLNLQPRITPVLDLSNINATPINLTASITSARMLGSDPSVTATQVTNSITFGDFKFDIQAKDTATSKELVDMIHSKFQGWLAQEVRKIKEVR